MLLLLFVIPYILLLSFGKDCWEHSVCEKNKKREESEMEEYTSLLKDNEYENDEKFSEQDSLYTPASLLDSSSSSSSASSGYRGIVYTHDSLNLN